MSNRKPLPGWLLPAGLVVVVGVLVTIALVREPIQLDPDSPEGTVQEYLVAINEKRWADALEVVHPDSLGTCDADDLSRFDPGSFTAREGAPDLFGSPVVNDVFAGEDPNSPLPTGETTVNVTISRDGGGVGGGWDEYVSFELTNDGEFWWIVGDPWPYFVWSCR